MVQFKLPQAILTVLLVFVLGNGCSDGKSETASAGEIFQITDSGGVQISGYYCAPQISVEKEPLLIVLAYRGTADSLPNTLARASVDKGMFFCSFQIPGTDSNISDGTVKSFDAVLQYIDEKYMKYKHKTVIVGDKSSTAEILVYGSAHKEIAGVCLISPRLSANNSGVLKLIQSYEPRPVCVILAKSDQNSYDVTNIISANIKDADIETYLLENISAGLVLSDPEVSSIIIKWAAGIQ